MTIARPDIRLYKYKAFTHKSLFRAESAFLKQSLLLLAFFALLFSFAACSTATSPTTAQSRSTAIAVGHASPTPTALPPGIVLYQADWSHGLAGWPGTQGWKVVQGQLETDSSDSALFTIPYRPPVNNYAVEIRLQIVRLLSENGGSFFSIFALKAPGKDGYQAGVSNLVDSVTRPFGEHPQSQVFLDPQEDTAPGSGLPTANYPAFGWHTYSVEVQGKEVRLLDNGVQIGNAEGQQDSISNGPLGLSCGLIVLHVSSVRILTL